MKANLNNNKDKNFDSFFKNTELYYGEEPSIELIDLINKKLIPEDSLVLELGCGEGRDTFFLAKSGFSVVALDISKKGIDKLNKRAKQMNLHIDARCVNVKEFRFSSINVDLIVADTLLDQLESKNQIEIIINELKNCLKPEGIMFLRDFTTQDPGCTHVGPSSDTASLVNHYFETNELISYFENWKIILHEEKIVPDDTHGNPHFHGIVVIIVQK